jgi:hypothetical protein
MEKNANNRSWRHGEK